MKLPRLKYWREMRGYTQRELVPVAGVSHGTIAHVELNPDANVLPTTARKLAAALDVDITDLAGVEDRHPKFEAPSFNQPSLIDEEHRRPLTPAELNAIETMKEKCARLETFLDGRGGSKARSENATLEVWEHFERDARETAALTLPLAEREPVRSRFIPVAARFVELANRVIEGARAAGVAEQDRAAIHEFEKAVA